MFRKDLINVYLYAIFSVALMMGIQFQTLIYFV